MMIDGRVSRGVVVFVCVFAGVTYAADVLACSCVGGAHVVWPIEDATAVAVNTSLVLAGGVSPALFGEASAELPLEGPDAAAHVNPDNRLVLVSSSGESVRLTLGPVAAAPDCLFKYYFATPKDELSANTRYDLRLGDEVLRTFTTGDAPRDASSERAAAEKLSFEVLGVTGDPTVITTAFVTNVGEQPLYLNFDGSLEESTVATRDYAARPIQLDFGSLVCPEVRILGSAGDLILSRSLCAADRCLPNDGSATRSSCGGNFAVDINYERFEQLPLGCSAAPTTDDISVDGGQSSGTPTADEPGGSLDGGDISGGDINGGGQPDVQKVAVNGAKRGCSVSPAHGFRGVGIAVTFVAAIALGLWRRKRV